MTNDSGPTETFPIEDLVLADNDAAMDEALYAKPLDEAAILSILAPFSPLSESGAPASLKDLKKASEISLLGGSVLLLSMTDRSRLRVLMVEPHHPTPQDWWRLVNTLRSHADSVGARLAPEAEFGKGADG